MRPPVPHRCILSLLLSLHAALSLGQETGITQKHHPWGRFRAGAWRRVRMITETFDQDQTLTSTTESKTTLKKVEDDGVTLLVETVVNVGGKEIRAEPQTVKQGWHGELAGQNVKVTQLGTEEVRIQDQRIPCTVQQLELTSPTSKTSTKIYYSDTVPPYILKRESIRTDLKGTTRLGETTVEVKDLGFRWRILANVNTFSVEALHKHPKGKRTTWARISMRVPGEEICRTSQEFDLDGRLIGRSRMELVEYGLTPSERWTVHVRRKRPSRLRRLHRFSPYRPHEPPESED